MSNAINNQFNQKLGMGTIAIEGMEFYSYHGHFEEESVIGTKFIIDLYLETDTSKAEQSDRLQDTVNYLDVYQCVKDQMKTSSYLIEHVARRILDALLLQFSAIEAVEIKLRKLNPPLGGQMESVSITLDAQR
jgi:dihydroneopterin aldolase